MPSAETLSLIAVLARAPQDHPALVGHTECLTYRGLLARVRAIAHDVQHAVPPGATVATMVPHSPAGIAAILGCIAAGRLCIPLNPGEPPDRMALLLEDAAPTLVLTPARAAAAPPAPPGWNPPPPDPDSPATVHFTSGSSGRPKGIVLSHYAILHRACCFIAACGVVPADRLLATSPPSIGGGLGSLLSTLIAGATLSVTSLAADGATTLLALAARQRITVLVAPVALLRLLLGLPAAPAAFAALRHIRSGAMAMPSGDLRGFRTRLPPGCEISHGYASTEALEVAYWTVPPGAEDNAPTIASGYITPGQDYALLDEAGAPTPAGSPGEMVLRGRHIALGEWQRGRLVPGRMTPGPDNPGQRIFRTGDIMRFEPSGLLRFVGRADRQIKVNGVRIEPAEIEAVLRRTEGVTDAAVVADETGRLVAFVVAAHTGTLRATLAGHLRASLPAALRPARITVLPALPLLPSGKPDLQALQARATTEPVLEAVSQR